MKKTLLTLLLSLSAFFSKEAIGQTNMSNNTVGQNRIRPEHEGFSSENKDVKPDPKFRGPDLRAFHEYHRTKNPFTGKVPKEKLLEALERTKKSKADVLARRLQSSSQKSSGDNLKTDSDGGSTAFNRAAGTSSLNWLERGPYSDVVGSSNGNTRANSGKTSGRIRAVMVDSADATKKTVWVGGVAGGIWKTNDITVTNPVWELVDDYLPNMAISSICQDPSVASGDVMYFCTGESYYNADAVKGLGVFKSIDHGVTWTQLTSTSSYGYCTKIVCDYLGNVYLATRGNGLLRSTNGGSSWTAITPTGLSSSICDIELTTTAGPARMHVTTGISGTSGYRFTDNPASVTTSTWTSPTVGFTSTSGGRIEISCVGSTLYALPTDAATDEVPTIYKSTNGGVNWSATTTQPASGWASGQGWYALALAINPGNTNQVIVGGLDNYKTSDGGATWSQISYWVGTSGQYVHADIQDIQWFDGGNKLVIASDGGIFYSSDGGTTFRDRNVQLRLKQFYSVAIHPTSVNYFLGGTQDNGVHQLNGAGLTTSVEVTGGDGAFVAIDQNEPSYQYGSYVYSQYRRSTNGGTSWSSIRFYKGTSASPSNFGSFINPYDYDDSRNIMYASADGGEFFRWTTAQTTAAGSYYRDAGFPSGASIISGITALNSSRVSAIKVSPFTANRVYFGTQGGRVIRMNNADTVTLASSGVNITGTGMTGTVSCINVGTNDSFLIVSYSNYGVSNVWITSNGGTSWTAVDGNLPDMPVRWCMFFPGSNTKAILATETGVWETELLNGSSTVWTANPTFPTVRTDMLDYRPGDSTFVAGTHGRGIFSSKICANPPATPTGTDGSRCTIGTLTLTATPGTGETIDWFTAATGGNILLSGNASFTTPSLSSTKTYYASARNTSTGCVSESRVAVTANIGAINPPTGADSSRCGPGVVTLAAIVNANETVDWYSTATGGTPILSGSNSYTTPSLNTSTTYYAQSRSTINSCTSTTRKAITAYIISIPNAPTAINGFRCGTGTVSISATPGAFETIDWYAAASGGSALATGSSSYTTPSISANTTYYAESRNTNSSCLAVSATRTAVTASVISNPSAPAAGNASRCGAGTVTISASTTSGKAIDWFTAISGGTALLTGSNTYTTPSISSTTNYYAESRDTTFGCKSTTRTLVTATVNALPSISASASPANVCLGNSTSLNVTSGNANYRYTWTPGNNTGSSLTVTPSQNISYTVNAIDSIVGSPNLGCQTSATVSITVLDSANTPIITPSSSSICLGEIRSLSGTSSSANSMSFGTGTATNTAASTGSAGYPAPYNLYYGGQRMQMLIRASELTAAGFNAGDQLSSLQFSVTAIGSLWGSTITKLDSFRVRIGHTDSTVINTFQPGLTQVVAPSNFTPATGFGNSHTFSSPFVWNGTKNIVIETTFSNNILGDNGMEITQYNSSIGFTGCIVYRADNVTAAAAASATTVNFKYSARPDFKLNGISLNQISWSPTTNLFTDSLATTAYTGGNRAIVYAKPAAAGVTTITSTATRANGCTKNKDVILQVQNIPALPSATGVSRCGNGAVTLSASAGAGETTDWYSSATGGILLASGQSSYNTGTISTTTTYYVQSRNTVTGCKSNGRTAVIATVNPIPATPSTTGGSRCGSGTVELTASAGVGETIDWYAAGSGGTALSSGSTTFITPSISSGTTYYAEARNTTTGCASSVRQMAVATVNSYPDTPSISYFGTASFCDGSSITLRSSSSANNFWNTGATSDSIIVDSTGDFYVSVTSNGCTSNSDTVSVQKINCGTQLQIKLFIQGFYDNAGIMRPALLNSGVDSDPNKADSIIIELKKSYPPYETVGSYKTTLSISGVCNIYSPDIDSSYYIVAKHRNSIETWSANPVTISNGLIYDFTDNPAKAYGDNMIIVAPGHYAIYSGDINQDGMIESLDYLKLETDILYILFGYEPSDITGDGVVESADYNLIENNILKIIFLSRP
jgi:hypothetical protein